MTRDAQLHYCKKCTHRQMDMQVGLVCSLTGAQANFVNECPDFQHDHSVPLADDGRVLDSQEVKEMIREDVYEQLRLEQNLPFAAIAGIAVGLIGAILWGVITVATNFQIGLMAIGIGAAVGYAIRYAGKGIDPIFGWIGASIAVISCAVGNFLSVIGFVANSEGLNYVETLVMFDYSYTIPVMMETFSFMDLVFYSIAGYEGYKFAFRQFDKADVAAHQ